MVVRMKSILVPLEDCPGAHAQLATTFLAADKFASYVAGVAPRTATEIYYYGEGFSPVALDQWEQEEKAHAERASSVFRDFANERKVAWGDPLNPSGHVTADWFQEVATGDDSIGQLARIYDITVLARPMQNATVPRSALLEAVLFESGRPIMVAPPEAPAHLGEVILVAWNGSTESARAITFAQPFLARAKRVIVLAVEGGMVAGPSAGDVQHALRRAGIEAEAIEVSPQTGQSTGETILAEAAKVGADLLVKGAYTHSRLRQMIFGGATSHVMSESNLPVLMAH